MDGVLNINKPSGPTSHDIVDEIRRIFGQRRVGHAGTLDPMASGVLVVCLGKATRIVEYLMGLPKEYRARMVLGVSTDTQDSTGRIVLERDASYVKREALEEVVREFVGEIEQVPPMISAVKHHGKRLYELARQGKSVDRLPRKVVVYSIEIKDYMLGQNGPEAELLVRCSSGTYIRTLCADIGEKLGCGAHMSALERTKVGRFNVEDSLTIDQVRAASAENRLGSVLMSIGEALEDLPFVKIEEDDVPRVANGLAVPCVVINGVESSSVRIVSSSGMLVGLGNVMRTETGCMVKPHKVLLVEGSVEASSSRSLACGGQP